MTKDRGGGRPPDDPRDLKALVHARFHTQPPEHPQHTPVRLALRALVGAEVDRASRRYPDAYFPGAARSAAAVDEVASVVYDVADRVPKARAPFGTKERPVVPFDSYVEQGRDEAHIRAWTFTAWLSVTKEVLRGHYKCNLRRDPVLAAEARLYKEVRASFAALATPLTYRHGRPDLWCLPDVRPLRPISDEALVESLRERRASVDDAVHVALSELGPCTPARVTRALWRARHGDEGGAASPEPSTAPGDPYDRQRIRDTVAAAWAALQPDDRLLLSLIAGGASYREASAALPDVVPNQVAVMRALQRINRQLFARLASATGAEIDPKKPSKEMIERLHEVLATMGILEAS
jgi:hypothetical protein